ncbi:MAG: UDP-N-acetylmuramoyl-L-alanine--D-glutamate ligase [Actinobacteria bacterium]|nr:UDP-N-acetylmuramoyl-L-alanine--D-glutamate ligase [Actinomycetota bacterium]MCL5446373.1 UDP-N-acetylmuramoyl-L-alanine--D-glutamate ligase [Actinomycetota bacterium]
MAGNHTGGYVLVFGAGVTGRAVVDMLLSEGQDVVVADDSAVPRRAVFELNMPDGYARPGGGIRIVRAPRNRTLERLVAGADRVVVSPGVPRSHPIHRMAAGKLTSEVGLARARLQIPFVGITGTNGKTTVVTLVASMLEKSHFRVAAAGNIGLPLISVIHRSIDVVVAELSSFQLATTSDLAPTIGAWLNFQPDHLDWHTDMKDYRLSKTRIWEGVGPGCKVVANWNDEVVMEAARQATGTTGAELVAWGDGDGSWHREGDLIISPDGDTLVSIRTLYRSMPHDVDNALAALAVATSAGANLDGCAEALAGFNGLPHRVELVADIQGVRYLDDSKSTTPSSTAAALAGMEDSSAVLIAGGRNKGLDLGTLRSCADTLKAVVAIGEDAHEVMAALETLCPVKVAGSMDEAVALATGFADRGDSVILSPACASYDWYGSYASRGDDFRRCVLELQGTHVFGEDPNRGVTNVPGGG